MSELIKAIRKARQGQVEVGKFVFIVRRPTDAEVNQFSDRNPSLHEVASEFTTDWKNVEARDIEPSTKSDDPVTFDPELWREWCADRPDFWAPITNKVMEMYRQHQAKLETTAKN